MNQATQKFIENVITEAALDSRISDGIVNLGDSEHLIVIAEKMYDAGIDEQIINEFVDKFMEEGKYPDRQAYNKEGWLVTFPSKEYRDAAIKKGTHAISDPTHGKGGMNLYYKKKGKQKRQAQQQATATKTGEEPPTTKAASPELEKQAGEKSGAASKSPVPSGEEAADDAETSESPEQEFDRLSGSDEEADAGGETTSQLPAATQAEKPEDSTSKGAPATTATPASAAEPKPTEPTPPPPPPYAKLSKEFATTKGWKPTPYGEWRNAAGETQAVVSLSDEVVPLKSVDRDELKLFVEKRIGTM